MLIIPVKPNESIDRALKRYKQKYRRTKVKELMHQKSRFVKPSAAKRETLKKAIHRERYLRDQEE